MYSWKARAARTCSARTFGSVLLPQVLGAGQGLARPPVVRDLVVVPLRQHRDLRVQREQVSVEQVVLVAAPELGEGFGRLRDLLGHAVPPEGAVGQLHLGLDRPVGVDRVAGMEEEVRPVLGDGRIDRHAATGFVDPPALARRVPRPAERHRAPVGRRRAEAPDLPRTADRRGGEVFEADPVEDVLAGGRPSRATFTVPSVSGRASAKTPPRTCAKLSVVDHSIIARQGRSARAQTMAVSLPTSPDCSPCERAGRSAARLR